MIAAIIDTSIVQRRLSPYLAPNIVQSVMVPGPINAAAIRGPGPIFSKNLLTIFKE
jgi:hypothetical protein